MTYPKDLIKQAIELDIANKKYNPMNDVLFKFIFGKEERKQVTIDFLNAVLGRHGAKAIKDIQFQNSQGSRLTPCTASTTRKPAAA